MGMDRTVTERHGKSNKRSVICYAVTYMEMQISKVQELLFSVVYRKVSSLRGELTVAQKSESEWTWLVSQPLKIC